MTRVHRTQLSATAVLCGASIFAYPAIAWGACAPATVDTGAPIVATDQLLEQVRQRREQQATASMFSAAGTSAAAAPALKPRPSAASTRATSFRLFRTRFRKRQGGSERYAEAKLIKVSTAPAAAGATALAPAGTATAVPASIARPSAGATEQYSPSGYSDSGYSLKDVPNANEAQNGVWAGIYGAYERHDNLAPGQDNNATRTQYTKGLVSGIDTYVSPAGGGYGAPQIQLGILGGYESTRSAFTTPPAYAADTTEGNVNGTQIDEGGFVGIYGSYVLNQFAADLLVKVDLFDHTTEPSITCNPERRGAYLSRERPLRQIQTLPATSIIASMPTTASGSSRQLASATATRLTETGPPHFLSRTATSGASRVAFALERTDISVAISGGHPFWAASTTTSSSTVIHSTPSPAQGRRRSTRGKSAASVHCSARSMTAKGRRSSRRSMFMVDKTS